MRGLTLEVYGHHRNSINPREQENKRYEDVTNLWELFEKGYGFVGVQAFSHPHIAFQGNKTDNLVQFTRDFQEMVSKTKPFGIEVSGVGHFNREVIYLRVKKTSGLIRINKQINQFVQDRCEDLFPYHTPEDWIPHITLAMDDLTEQNFEKAWAEFTNSKIEFNQELHNTRTVKWYPDGKIRIVEKWEL